MAEVMNLGFLDFIPKVFLGLAVIAWLATMAGIIRSILRRMRPGQSAS